MHSGLVSANIVYFIRLEEEYKGQIPGGHAKNGPIGTPQLIV